jgi:hypothetical protein
MVTTNAQSYLVSLSQSSTDIHSMNPSTYLLSSINIPMNQHLFSAF